MPVRTSLLAFAFAGALLRAQQPVTSTASEAEPHQPIQDTSSGSLASQITAILQDPAVARAHWGIAISDMDGTPLYTLNDRQLFRPASTAKLFTTAAAMSLLGPDSTTTTEVSFQPPAPDGTIEGDLTLTGHQDPDLSAHEPPWTRPSSTEAPAASNPLHGVEEFVADVLARGVHHITGDIVASEIVDPYPQGWAAEDLTWGYGAPVSAISVNDNQLLLTVTAGSAPGQPVAVTLTPDTGFYRVVSTATTGEPKLLTSGITVHHMPSDGSLRIQGTLPVGKSYKTELAIDDPALFAAQALRRELVAAGVRVDGQALAVNQEEPDVTFLHVARQRAQLGEQIVPSAATVPHATGLSVLQHTSRTLADDIVPTLKESLNLHAELIFRRLGSRLGTESAALGAQAEHQWLMDVGLDDQEFFLYDGSGLSTKDLVSPHAEAQLLVVAAGQPWFPRWKPTLPVGGVDGTLASRFPTPPLKGQVFAKTGTLGETRVLAGYLRCASGKQIVFSIMVDNHVPGSSADRAAMDRIVAVAAQVN